MAFWGLGIVVAPMLGPVLGGWLTDSYSWRWVFYINIPVGIASIIMTRLFIFDPPYIRRKSEIVDYWGIGMLAVGIGALQIVLDKGQEEDWFASHWILALALISGGYTKQSVTHLTAIAFERIEALCGGAEPTVDERASLASLLPTFIG